MPTYINSGSSTVIIDNPPLKIRPGATVALTYYIKTLPTGVTKTSDLPLAQPWDLLATVSSFPSTDIDVYMWDNIIVYNASSGVVTLAVNGDDENALIIPPGAKEVYDNSMRHFGFLTVLTNAGSGSFSVWGSR